MAQTINKEWQVRRPNGQSVGVDGGGLWTRSTDEVTSMMDGVMADLARAGAVAQKIMLLERTVTTVISEPVVLSETAWPAA